MQVDNSCSCTNAVTLQKIYGTSKTMFNNKQCSTIAVGSSIASEAVYNGQINITLAGEPWVETIKTWHASGKRWDKQQRESGQNKEKWNRIKRMFGKPMTRQKVKGYQPIWSANDAV